ncbi:MAG: hypothetical protein ACP5SH_27550 [Syntrophobacteraceae bacterium]
MINSAASSLDHAEEPAAKMLREARLPRLIEAGSYSGVCGHILSVQKVYFLHCSLGKYSRIQREEGPFLGQNGAIFQCQFDKEKFYWVKTQLCFHWPTFLK